MYIPRCLQELFLVAVLNWVGIFLWKCCRVLSTLAIQLVHWCILKNFFSVPPFLIKWLIKFSGNEDIIYVSSGNEVKCFDVNMVSFRQYFVKPFASYFLISQYWMLNSCNLLQRAHLCPVLFSLESIAC